MGSLIQIVTGAAATLLAAYSLGRAAWRFRPPHWTLALASGATLLSAIIFALLSAGWAKPAALGFVVVACFAGLAPRRGGALPGWRPRLVTAPAVFIALVLAVYFVYYLVHALAPATQPDEVTYHLGLVAEWLRTGRFAARIGFYEMLPLGLETLFLPAFAAGAHSAAKLVHFAFFCASVPLIVRIGRGLGLRADVSLGAAALYALAPVVGISGTTSYNDAALVFFNLAVFALLLEDHAAPRWELVAHAGLAAGFCFAIKPNGLLAVPVALAWIAWQRRWRAAVLVAACAMISILPWLLRDTLLCGNPLAPLANRLFPNDWFHGYADDALLSFLANYEGISWARIPWALAVSGRELQGLVGPVFLLAPLAFLAARSTAGRIVLAVALVLLLPWTRNIGARFVMPSLVFVAIALAMALPRRLLWALVSAHALLCWPAVRDLYSDDFAWKVKGFPWRAALRVQPEEEYLAAALWDFRLARAISAHVRPTEGVLDLLGLPSAYLPAVPVGPMPSAKFDNIAATLRAAASAEPDSFQAFACRFPQRFARAVRVRAERSCPAALVLSEISVLRDGRALPVSRRWFLDAWPYPGDAWLAMDSNRASRWNTWDDARPGMYWQLDFDRPVPVDGVKVFASTPCGKSMVSVYVQGLDRAWRCVSDQAEITAVWPRPFRRSAIQFLRDQGIDWIATRVGGDGDGLVGQSLVSNPDAWGVEVVEQINGSALIRCQRP